MNRPAQIVTALAAGAVFGLGLSLSGMLDPARVRGFLDVAGAWDPSLAFVLGGAVAVALAGMVLLRRMRRPAFDDGFHLPATSPIDRRLVLGSAIFGIGWGMAGFCPGPALASLSLGLAPVVLFVIAMLAGMTLHDRAWLRRTG
ncbi:YeeE/YedE family protein [Bosea sp. (in: a-proteobacteria)]|uniref:YeeE/YedE family protein n=1 Tax=Bosea sp. (in: a-proteobacteria) TaxID=1871050 RepID=UPI002FC7A128